eukprot:Plantae.Rhodophyta-Purpureofilum_apyrenoidigerum.ctg2344.p1 GENE.Plantae.Rhodophyta-Purpureofilum_apyrenoidigerum.ctg2344~~Plantae.Rhodophyta-Purpureofilum_apyrenoidigerum.ctg2344.p1  ORF type:complete len:757 (-),score=151.20 Plantae.Rhodophyta-Purpureofilum_apyrenoidigerum.ctg2344:1482-3752(-)
MGTLGFTWSGFISATQKSRRCCPAVCVSAEDTDVWLSSDDSRDGKIVQSSEQNRPEPQSPMPQSPMPQRRISRVPDWQSNPERLFIPEELMVDPTFKYEAQGLMLNFFRGRLDKDYTEALEQFRLTGKPATTKEDLERREQFKEAAMKAIKKNPQSWLLRNWRTNKPIEVDSVYSDPWLMKGSSVGDLRIVSSQKPLIDREVAEELDELAIEEEIIRKREMDAREGRLYATCKSCGNEVPATEIEQFGACLSCSNESLKQRSHEIFRSYVSERKTPEHPFKARSFWPEQSQNNPAEASAYLYSYLSTKNVENALDANKNESDMQMMWFLGGDPAAYATFDESVDEDFTDSEILDDFEGDDNNANVSTDSLKRNSQLQKEDVEMKAPLAAWRKLCDLVATSPLNVSGVLTDRIAVTVGSEGALSAALLVLCKSGDNILIPAPCDGMYELVAKRLGVQVRVYDVKFDESNGWTLNFQQISNLLDHKSRALILNNPNRIAGFVHNEDDLDHLAQFCKDNKLPVISDEALHDMIFQTEWYGKMPKGVLESKGTFVSFSEVAGPSQLVFTLGESSHRLLSPMMRLGWLAVSGSSQVVSEGLCTSLKRFAGAQFSPDLHHAVPALSQTLDEQCLKAAEKTVANNCRSISKLISGVHGNGFRCIVPHAGKSLLVVVDADMFGIENETALCNTLLWNEAIGIVPGAVVRAPGYVYLETVPGKVLVSAGYIVRSALEQMRVDAEERNRNGRRIYNGGVHLANENF